MNLSACYALDCEKWRHLLRGGKSDAGDSE